MPCACAIWCAGTAPQPLIEDLRATLPPDAFADDGRLDVDAWLRVAGDDARGIFALGDAARCVPPGEREPVPQTAQVAGQQGAYVARLLNRRYALGETPPAGQHKGAKVSPLKAPRISRLSVSPLWFHKLIRLGPR